MDAREGKAMSEAIEQIEKTRPRRFRPYTEYKDSGVEWLGEIPAYWKVKKLSWLTKCQDGKRIPLNAEERGRMQGEYPYWGANSIVDHVDEWLFDEELVLLGEDGAPFFDKSRPVAFRVAEKIWVNNHAHVLRPLSTIDAKFLVHVLNCVDYRAFIDGSTRDKLTTQGDMNGIPVQCPEVAEQRAIAAFLDREMAKIDGLVARKERLCELLQEKRTALITRAVTRGLDPNVSTKDSGVEWLGEIPAHWEVKRLKFMLWAPLKYGANEAAELDDPDLPRYVRITDIDENDGLRDETFKSLPIGVAQEYLLRVGDLLFARSGATAGKTFLYRSSWGICAYAGYLIRARLDTAAVCPEFVRYFTASSSYWQWLSATFIQATIQNVSADKYASLTVPQPAVDEQRAVVAILNHETAKTDALIAKVRDAIDLLKEFRTGLISAAVAGKIDVREASA